MERTEAQQIVAELLASVSLADHVGDALGDLLHAARKVGLEVPKMYSQEEVSKWCAKNGVRTLYGTSLQEDND